jgi:hypothetical protein
MSCIYRVPISIYVSLIRHMHRERCTIWKHILPDWTIHTLYSIVTVFNPGTKHILLTKGSRLESDI